MLPTAADAAADDPARPLLAPVGSQPMPLGAVAGWLWAVALLALVGVLGLVVPSVANAVYLVSTPPDVVRFGAASLVPAVADVPWQVDAEMSDADTLTMVKGSMVLTATTVADDLDLEVHLALFGDDLTTSMPELAGRGLTTYFTSPLTGTRGGLLAYPGEALYGVVAALPAPAAVDGDTAGSGDGVTVWADLSVVGDAQEVTVAMPEIQEMLASIRFRRGAA